MVTWCPTNSLGPIGSAVLMFIGYKPTDKPNLYIDSLWTFYKKCFFCIQSLEFIFSSYWESYFLKEFKNDVEHICCLWWWWWGGTQTKKIGLTQFKADKWKRISTSEDQRRRKWDFNKERRKEMWRKKRIEVKT